MTVIQHDQDASIGFGGEFLCFYCLNKVSRVAAKAASGAYQWKQKGRQRARQERRHCEPWSVWAGCGCRTKTREEEEEGCTRWVKCREEVLVTCNIGFLSMYVCVCVSAVLGPEAFFVVFFSSTFSVWCSSLWQSRLLKLWFFNHSLPSVCCCECE